MNHSVQPSDIDDPEWHQTFNVDDGSMTFDSHRHGNAGILTIHGVLDAMNGLGEELHDYFQHLMEEGRESELPEWFRKVLPRNVPMPVNVRSEPVPSASWISTSFVIPGSTTQPTLISNRSDRNRAVISNQGANPAFISWTDDATTIATAGENAWIALPNGNGPGNPRELRAGGKIWVYSALGTVVDIVEEYGSRLYELGQISA